MQQQNRILGSPMENGPRDIDLSPFITECLDALAWADADRLERSEMRMREIERAWLDGRDRARLEAGVNDVLAFARVLQTTRANLDLIGKFARANSVDLEYWPNPAVRECIAKG
ncbi:MAG TPA: hypothetical protein VN753_10455 [Terracidiphilus sp.]|nr:hypothetical protein [Terracidiphilus sp.]